VGDDVRAGVRCDGKLTAVLLRPHPASSSPGSVATNWCRKSWEVLRPSAETSASSTQPTPRDHCRGTRAKGLTTTDGGEDQIGLHPVGEIQVTQLPTPAASRCAIQLAW
jgi:hypothetical protein